ncbi:hypothetical protein Bcep22_gp47 [Burkholderia phage Bcep22]|uniref:Uncharacterized protein n=1 Tax=Burkholderia phage Bcep22 TaxID=2883944 RepID=Q6V7P6_9CAUD|nr:hypothetical protein Bcep22_gp47 [Burkholderia phage Bcep22]AAQ54980.1 hypothetical protein Bcep22_gp47 [Burkholderia phage Bcep22]
MTNDERLSRHARSMALHGTSVALAAIATVCGLIGIALTTFAIAGVILLIASVAVSRCADKVSPYRRNAQ